MIRRREPLKHRLLALGVAGVLSMAAITLITACERGEPNLSDSAPESDPLQRPSDSDAAVRQFDPPTSPPAPEADRADEGSATGDH